MPPIPVGGLATGLDTGSLVQQLLAVERRPITRLDTQKLKLQAQSTAFTDLNGKLLTLKAKADALADPAAFSPRSVTSSAETVATATATAGNLRGTFTLTVSALARGSIAAAATTKSSLSDAVASADGSLQFTLGTDGTVVSVAVTAATTLDQLVTAINDANAGVRASAVNVGTASAPAYKLTLTSNATGAANNIVIVSDGTTLGVTTTQAALDAAFTVTGLGSLTRATNTFSDVIEGVTITLKAGSGSTDLAVDFDKGGTQAKLQALVDAYNDVIRAIRTQTVATKGADGRLVPGAFTGDVVPRQIQSALAGAIASQLTGTLKALPELGITTQKDGTLTLDGAKLQKALTDSPEAVRDLVAGSSTRDGIADLLSKRLDAATKAVTGTIAARQDGITTSIRTLQRQIDAALTRLDTTERTLRARFNNLETVVARIQQSGTALLAELQRLDTR